MHYRNPPGKRSDILVFFETVSKFYEKCNRPSDLFLDLIQLKDLLTSSTNTSLVETDETAFHQFLYKKNKPNVSNAILKELSTFIVSFIVYMYVIVIYHGSVRFLRNCLLEIQLTHFSGLFAKLF